MHGVAAEGILGSGLVLRPKKGTVTCFAQNTDNIGDCPPLSDKENEEEAPWAQRSGVAPGLVLVWLISLAWLWPRTGARAMLLPPYFIT